MTSPLEGPHALDGHHMIDETFVQALENALRVQGVESIRLSGNDMEVLRDAGGLANGLSVELVLGSWTVEGLAATLERVAAVLRSTITQGEGDE